MSKLERTTLQLEGAQTRIEELERINDELKRTNADIQRQLNKWQSLETKGGAEVESLRKAKVELEVQVRALEGQLEKRAEEEVRLKEREKTRVSKLKESMAQWQARRFPYRLTNTDLVF